MTKRELEEKVKNLELRILALEMTIRELTFSQPYYE